MKGAFQLAELTSPSRTVVLTRVGLDQFVLTPVLVGVFFTSMSLMEGKGIDEAKRRVKNFWFPTLQKNWSLFSAFRRPLVAELFADSLRSPRSARQLRYRPRSSTNPARERSQSFLEVSRSSPFLTRTSSLTRSPARSAYLSYANSQSGAPVEDKVKELIE